MATFIFKGDKDGDGPDVSTHYGVTFIKGKETEVEDGFQFHGVSTGGWISPDPVDVVAKLRGNSHFVEVDAKPLGAGNRQSAGSEAGQSGAGLAAGDSDTGVQKPKRRGRPRKNLVESPAA